MIQDQPVRRVKPLAERRENITGRHLGEHRFLRIGFAGELVKAAVINGIVCRRLREANPISAVFQGIDAPPLAKEV